MSSSALPLNVSTPSKPAESDRDRTPTSSGKQPSSSTPKVGVITASDISSPHELTAFVENLLERLNSNFDEMSNQILDRMNQMSGRVDALEAAIQDIINGDITAPQSPSPAPNTFRPDVSIIFTSDRVEDSK